MGQNFRQSLAATLALGVFATSPVMAWDVSVGTEDFLDNLFYIETFSGNPDLALTQRGVRADTGTTGFPINWTFQSWDGSNWPTGDLSDLTALSGPAGNADVGADIYNNDAGMAQQYPDSSDAAVYGQVNPGNAAGAAFAYDFTLTLAAGEHASLILDGSFGSIFGDVIAEVGDSGTGFASLKLYDPTVDINDPNGVNNPYRLAFAFQQATGTTVESSSIDLADFTPIDFMNSTGGTASYNLRLEGSASVFSSVSTVPLPAAVWLFGSALIGVGVVSRREKKRA